LAALIPLETRDSPSTPVTTTAQLTPNVEVVAPPPPPEPEFEIPEEQDEPVDVRDDLQLPPEEIEAFEEEWDDAQEDELRDAVRDTIFCPDPRAAGGRFRPSRGRAAPEPEEPATAEFPTVPVRRPPAAEPKPPPRPTPAAVVAHVAPRYPRSARERGLEGVVTLKVVVEANGDLGDISIVKSSGYALLDRAAIAAVEDWEFRPATVQGKPVRSTLDLPPIRFRLTD
jgi:protein TonB